METIQEILEHGEVYSNTRIQYILNCRRKAWFRYLFEGGLDAGVGPGAHIGSSFHAALNAYYSSYSRLGVEDRELLAHRAFGREWKKHFDGITTERKHGLERGLYILDSYFAKYKLEDQLFKPVESELYFLLPIAPLPEEEPFEPFWWQGRADIVFERLATQERFVVETKCPGSGVERQLVRMQINRQMLGNVWALRQYPGELPITGAMSNVLLVAAEKIEFGREYHHYTEAQTESWRRQTIRIVEDWRQLIALSDGKEVGEHLDIFYQNDEECTSYGLCPYHRMCHKGLGQRDSMTFTTSHYNPFEKEHIE